MSSYVFTLSQDKNYNNGILETKDKYISTDKKSVGRDASYKFDFTWAYSSKPLFGNANIQVTYFDRNGDYLGRANRFNIPRADESISINFGGLPYRDEIGEVGVTMWFSWSIFILAFGLSNITLVDDYGGSLLVGQPYDYNIIEEGYYDFGEMEVDLDDFLNGKGFITDIKDVGIPINYKYQIDYDITFIPPTSDPFNTLLYFALVAIPLDINGNLITGIVNPTLEPLLVFESQTTSYSPKIATWELNFSTATWKDSVHSLRFVMTAFYYDTIGETFTAEPTLNTVRKFRLLDDNLDYHRVTFRYVDVIGSPYVFVLDGETVERLDNPIRVGYKFINWYTTTALTTLFNFATPITADTIIYAKWELIADNIYVMVNNEDVSVDGTILLELSRLETRDTGKLSIYSDRAERYEVDDIVDMTIYGTNYQMLVQRDATTRHNLTMTNHDLTLKEVISKFDGITPFDRPFTKVPAYTVGEILAIYEREMETYHNIIVDFVQYPEFSTRLPEREYSGQNMSVILADVYRTINAIPRCTYDYTTSTWVVTRELYNERNNLIVPKKESDQGGLDNLDYATSIKSQLKNSMYENEQGIWFPSKTGSVTPRTNGVVFRESEAQFELTSPIINLFEVLVIDVPISDSETPQVLKRYIDIDITDYVIEQELYDVLDPKTNAFVPFSDDSPNKRNCLRYKRGTSNIVGLYEQSSGFLGFTVEVNIWINAIRTVYENRLQVTGEVISGTYTNLYDMKLRVRYLPLRNLEFTVEKYDQRNMNKTSMFNKQSTSSVEIGQFKKNVTNVINMLGNEGKRFSETFKPSDTLYELGDYTSDNRLISKITYAFDTNYVTVHGVLTKNFANTESEYAISRIPSPFIITQKRLTTNMIYKNYLEISETKKEHTGALNRSYTDSIIWNTFVAYRNPAHIDIPHIWQYYNKPINGFVLVPNNGVFDINGVAGIHMPVITGGDGTVMTVQGEFEHQAAAGYVSEIREETRYKIPVMYTDENGMLESFKMAWIVGTVLISPDDYPLCTIRAIPANNNIDELHRIDLDSNASLAITIEVHVCTDNPDEIIASSFAKHCHLVKEFDEAPTIQIYKSSYPYTIIDKTIRTEDTLATGVTMKYEVESDFRKKLIITNSVSSQQYIALTIDNEIVIALNGYKATRTLYFNYLKEV